MPVLLLFHKINLILNFILIVNNSSTLLCPRKKVYISSEHNSFASFSNNNFSFKLMFFYSKSRWNVKSLTLFDWTYFFQFLSLWSLVQQPPQLQWLPKTLPQAAQQFNCPIQWMGCKDVISKGNSTWMECRCVLFWCYKNSKIQLKCFNQSPCWFQE